MVFLRSYSLFSLKTRNICVAITTEEQSYHSIILSCYFFSSVHIEENITKNSLFIFPVSHNATISVPGSWQMAGQVSVSFILHYQSVYQFRMSFLHSKTSWACQKWMTRKNRWGYLWTSSQIVVRWRYTLTFPPRDRLHRIADTRRIRKSLACGSWFTNSSRVLPTSRVVYQPINHRNLRSIA